MEYNYYNTNSFVKLMQYAKNLGRYGGCVNLFTIQCKGAFEGRSMRATETREVRRFLTSDAIALDGGSLIPAMQIEGATLEEVCGKALLIVGHVLDK